jgi:hypothetical protein
MGRNIAGAVFMVFCAMRAGRADLTMRYTITFKLGSFLPPQALDAMKQEMGNRIPEGTTVQIKGDRVYTSMGRMISIADYASGQITVIDPETKRYATVPLADFPAKAVGAQRLPPMSPDAQRIFDNMKLDVKSSKTGRTETIQGMRTEETLMVLTMEVTAGMQMRTEIHNWKAGLEDLKGTPAMRELAVWAGRPKAGLDPVDVVTKVLEGMPGMGEKLRAPMQEMMKAAGGAVIRTRLATYIPMMAQTLGGTADQPVAEVATDLAELSTDAVPDSRFEVPAGYQTASMEDLLAAMFPSTPPQLPPAGRGGRQ